MGGLAVTTAPLALADTGGYLYASEPCEHTPYATSGTGYWCVNYDWGPVHTTAYNDPSEISPYGYAYRNCADFVAWKVSTLGVSSAQYKGLGNATDWPTNAPNHGLTVNTTPAVGAAAVQLGISSNPYGHVAYISAYNSSTGVVAVQEYNYGEDGNYDTRSGTLSGLGFSQVVHFEQYETSGSGGSNSVYPDPVISSLYTSDGTQHVYSGNSSGSLFETWWNASSPTPTTWALANVGTTITVISAQETSDGNEHVYYGTNAGTVGEVWWGPSSNGVHMGQSTNIGAAVTALSSQVTSDGVQHIYSTDTAGTLYETWWGSGSSGATTDVVYNTGVNITGLSSQVTSDGNEHLFFGATNGQVGEVWWGPNSGGGHLGDTSNVGTNVTAVSSQVTSDGVRHIYSADSTGNLDETWWGPSSSGPTTWTTANVGHHPTSISSQITSDGTEHIYFGTSFGEFGEVWWNGTSNGVHLGQTYVDPAGVADYSISSQITTGGTQNVYAANTSGTIYAMSWGSGSTTTSVIGNVG